MVKRCVAAGCSNTYSDGPSFDINNFELPTHFSRRVTNSIADGTIKELDNCSAFIREIADFFEGILPDPTPIQYEAISRKVIDKNTQLRDSRKAKYWVS